MSNNFFLFENNGSLSLFENTPPQVVTTESTSIWNKLEKNAPIFFDKNGQRIKRPIKKRKKKILTFEYF